MCSRETPGSNDARLCDELGPRWDAAMFDDVAETFQPEQGQYEYAPGNEAEHAKLGQS